MDSGAFLSLTAFHFGGCLLRRTHPWIHNTFFLPTISFSKVNLIHSIYPNFIGNKRQNFKSVPFSRRKDMQSWSKTYSICRISESLGICCCWTAQFIFGPRSFDDSLVAMARKGPLARLVVASLALALPGLVFHRLFGLRDGWTLGFQKNETLEHRCFFSIGGLLMIAQFKGNLICPREHASNIALYSPWNGRMARFGCLGLVYSQF